MISMDIVPSTTYRGAPEQPSITFHGWSTHIDISKRPPLYTYASDEKAKIEDITKSFVEKNIVDVMKNWKELSLNKYISIFTFLAARIICPNTIIPIVDLPVQLFSIYLYSELNK
jgi:hypothetical protein